MWLVCLIGFALLVGMIVTALSFDLGARARRFADSLTVAQRAHYERIKRERLGIFLTSVGIGMYAAFVATLVYLRSFGVARSTTTSGGSAAHSSTAFASGCLFLAVTLVVQYFVYVMWPKSDWMIEHLASEQQRREWVALYRQMQLRWHGSILIGVVAYFMLGYSECGLYCAIKHSGQKKKQQNRRLSRHSRVFSNLG